MNTNYTQSEPTSTRAETRQSLRRPCYLRIPAYLRPNAPFGESMQPTGDFAGMLIAAPAKGFLRQLIRSSRSKYAPHVGKKHAAKLLRRELRKPINDLAIYA